MPAHEWTEDMKAALSKKMKAIHASKKRKAAKPAAKAGKKAAAKKSSKK